MRSLFLLFEINRIKWIEKKEKHKIRPHIHYYSSETWSDYFLDIQQKRWPMNRWWQRWRVMVTPLLPKDWPYTVRSARRREKKRVNEYEWLFVDVLVGSPYNLWLDFIPYATQNTTDIF